MKISGRDCCLCFLGRRNSSNDRKPNFRIGATHAVEFLGPAQAWPTPTYPMKLTKITSFRSSRGENGAFRSAKFSRIPSVKCCSKDMCKSLLKVNKGIMKFRSRPSFSRFAVLFWWLVKKNWDVGCKELT